MMQGAYNVKPDLILNDSVIQEILSFVVIMLQVMENGC